LDDTDDREKERDSNQQPTEGLAGSRSATIHRRASAGAGDRPFDCGSAVYSEPEAKMIFTRITVRPDVCTGKPCIRNLRFPVSRLLGLLAAGQSRDEVLRAYPYLESADIDEALRYAASLAEDETIELSG
jgi:uncharacterized protein (DUF433 family)